MIPARANSPLAWAALAAVACALCAVLSGPAGTFWTVDDAGKDLVLRNLLRHPLDPSLDYPGRDLDPGLAHFPMPTRGAEPYATIRDGRVLSQYAAPFVWLALPFAALSLPFARLLLPALGAGLAAWAAFRLGARLGGGAAQGAAAAAVTLVAAPMLFYGALFWEHTVTVGLAGASFVAITAPSPRPLRAGLLLGAALLLREELVLLALAIVVAAAGDGPPFTRARRFALGAGAGLAARLAFHRAVSGSWLGVHATLNRSEPFAHTGVSLGRLLLDPGASGIPTALALAALGALAIGASAAARRSAAGPALLAGGGIGLAAIAFAGWWRFPAGEDAALALRHSNSALLALPWALAAAFLPAAPARSEDAAGAERLLGRAALVFLVLFVSLVPARSITGVHPGPRMLLPLLPLVAAVAAARLRRGVGAWVLLPLLLAGAAWSGTALSLLHAKRSLSGELAAALRDRPETVVVTDLFWLPLDQEPLWDAKRFFLLRSDRDLGRIVDAARDAGETEILAAMAPGRLDAAPVASVRRDDLPSFSVDLHVLRLRAREEAVP